MNKRNKPCIFLRKGVALLLSLFLITAMSWNFDIPVARAATISAVGTTPPGPESPPATAGSGLPADDTQASQAEAMGFSSEQPARLSPSGKEVNKSKNPLGPNNVTLNRIPQLALSSFASISVYKNPLGTGRMFKNTLAPLYNLISAANPLTAATGTFGSSIAWATAERSITAADIDGNGKQEVVTAGLLKNSDGRTVSLHLMISDYNAITGNQSKDKDHTVVSSLSSLLSTNNTTQFLLITAGDFDEDGVDEIAVAAGNNLYLCKANLDSCQILSSTRFTSNLTSLGIADLQAADADGDGFPELLVTSGTSSIGSNPSYLNVYDGSNLSEATAQIKLQVAEGKYLRAASVAVGDVFGDGGKTILVGGRTTGDQVALAGIRFHPETEMYDSAPVVSYTVDAADFKAVKSDRMGLKCVSLKSPVPGNPQYVMLGGFLYLYDSSTDAFARQDVTLGLNTSKLDGNNVSKSHGSITNVNVDRDETYIFNVLVGNFDGNTLGEEQIILLHYNKWYSSEYVYATTCSINSAGTISAALLQLWKKDGDSAYTHPAIGAPDIYNRGTRLEFEPSKSTFMFSNPTVLAVLGAAPYYKELAKKYGALSNDGTTYGTESSSGSSESNGITTSFGVSFGYEKGYLFDNIKIGFETTVTNSFAYTWTNSKTVSKSVSFTNYCSDDQALNDDAAVITVIPYDVYYYKVYTYDAVRQTTNESEISMLVPYSPLTTIMPLTDYNNAAKTIQNAPEIKPEVLKHKVGDPRSYAQSIAALSIPSGKEVLQGGTSSNESENFVAAGTGTSSVQQAITTSASSERSFDYALDVNVAFNVNVFGFSAGVSGGAGYTRNATAVSSASTTRSGSVASVPRGYEGYNFNWSLVAYNYDLEAGSSTQECAVIDYLVKPIGSFPPAVPENLKLKEQTLKANTLQWEPAEGAAGYRIARSTSQSGAYTDVSGSLAGKDTSSYTDSNVISGQTYYYVILAYAAKDSLTTDPLEVKTLSVTGITVKTQPKLVYTDGDCLDLSALMITIKQSNNVNKDVAFNKFSEENLTASLGNGVALNVGQTGTPVTVTYTPDKMTVNTNNLTVNAKNPYDLTFNVTFKVGNTNNAKALAANQKLTATTAMTNNKSSAQQVLVILALYNDKGTMVQNTPLAKNIAARASVTLTQSLDLPANITGYTAKVFVWDGTDYKSSTLSPRSPSVQIPTL